MLDFARDPGHDKEHARRVARDAHKIAVELGYTDPDLIEVCAWWHDVGRLYQNDHEKLSAHLLSRDLKTRAVSLSTRRKAYKAVYKHRWDMEPSTIEGKIIKDADKLDFLSTERWNQRQDAGEESANQSNLKLLPYVRKHLYFEVSRRLFDERLGDFAENLERSHVPTRHHRTLLVYSN